MPKNPVAPESSVYSVSGGGVGVAGPATPAAGASGRTANFSAATTTNSSYAGSGSVGTGKKLSTNGDVRIPLHPSQPRDDNQQRSIEAAQAALDISCHYKFFIFVGLTVVLGLITAAVVYVGYFMGRASRSGEN